MRGNMTQPEPKTLSRISALHETARRAFRIGAQEARRVLTAPGIHPDDRRITMDAEVLEHATRDMPRASLGVPVGRGVRHRTDHPELRPPGLPPDHPGAHRGGLEPALREGVSPAREATPARPTGPESST